LGPRCAAASHADERREHDEAIRRHQAQYRRLQDRINAMYVDKLDGLVETALFEKMSNRWREEQNLCLREIERKGVNSPLFAGLDHFPGSALKPQPAADRRRL
jgi:hypothetical protein